MIQRRTLRTEASIEGLGLHSGAPVRVTIFPGESGIRFRHGSSVVEAIPNNVSDTSRCTRLGGVSTIEHLMSALAGAQVTDAEIEVSAPELPGLDGSSAPFLSMIEEAGIESFAEHDLPELFARVFLQEDLIKIAVSKGKGQWSYTYDLGSRWPHAMSYESLNVVTDYTTDIAPARTLVLSEEIPHVTAAGLGRGLDKEAVLVIGEKGYENEARFENEPARHKLLDLIGDLYLSGVPIDRINVTATRSGHRTNVIAAARLREAVFGRSH